MVWSLLNFEVDRKVYFENIYNCMLTKYECDLIWKIMYGAIPTSRFMYGCRYWDSPNCNYWYELNCLTHICITWSRLSSFSLGLILKWTPTSDMIPVWYIIGIPGSCGLAVCSGSHCVVTLFKANLISRIWNTNLSVFRTHYVTSLKSGMHNNVENFKYLFVTYRF